MGHDLTALAVRPAEKGWFDSGSFTEDWCEGSEVRFLMIEGLATGKP